VVEVEEGVGDCDETGDFAIFARSAYDAALDEDTIASVVKRTAELGANLLKPALRTLSLTMIAGCDSMSKVYSPFDLCRIDAVIDVNRGFSLPQGLRRPLCKVFIYHISS
jgi:hypothetical protein